MPESESVPPPSNPASITSLGIPSPPASQTEGTSTPSPGLSRTSSTIAPTTTQQSQSSPACATPKQITTAKDPHPNLFRLWVILSGGLLILAPILSVMLGLNFHSRNFQYIPDKSTPTFEDRTLLTEAVLIRADPLAGTIILDWTIIGEARSPCSPATLDGCSDIDIFFDDNLLSSASDPSALRTSDRPTRPIFRFNASAFALQDIVANTPTFRTEVALFSDGTHQSSLIYYPFDQYSSEIFMFAQDTKTNNTLGLELAHTRGIAVGFKTMASTRSNVTIPVGMVDIVIALQRGNLIKAFSVVAVIAIWMITLILLLVMLTCVFFGFRQRGEVLVVPVATLFAFTQLRQSMPGAPEGFGDILDFVGLLPCLAILSLSAALTLGAFILSDPTDSEEKPQVLRWAQIFQAFPILQKIFHRHGHVHGVDDIEAGRGSNSKAKVS